MAEAITANNWSERDIEMLERILAPYMPSKAGPVADETAGITPTSLFGNSNIGKVIQGVSSALPGYSLVEMFKNGLFSPAENVIQGVKAVPGAASDVATGAGRAAASLVDAAGNWVGRSGSPTLGNLGVALANKIRPSEPEPAPTQPVISSLSQVNTTPTASNGPASGDIESNKMDALLGAQFNAPVEQVAPSYSPGINRRLNDFEASTAATAEPPMSEFEKKLALLSKYFGLGQNGQKQKPNKLGAVGNALSSLGLGLLAAGARSSERPHYINQMQTMASQRDSAANQAATLAQNDKNSQLTAALHLLGYQSAEDRQRQSDTAAKERAEILAGQRQESAMTRGHIRPSEIYKAYQSALQMRDTTAMRQAAKDIGQMQGYEATAQNWTTAADQIDAERQSKAAGPVAMVNPQGQTVQVPADKVQWARQNGYK